MIRELLDTNKIEIEESITYDKFLKLYEKYKDEFTEKEFAQILEISLDSYNTIKNKRSNSSYCDKKF